MQTRSLPTQNSPSKQQDKSKAQTQITAQRVFQNTNKHPSLSLQRDLGNRGMQRLLNTHVIQAKLKIASANDIYEQEADRIASQVMRMPEKPLQENVPTTPAKKTIQRQTKVDEEVMIRKKTVGKGSISTPSFEGNVRAIQDTGTPLPTSTRSFFEPRFRADFSNVRIHVDSNAARLAGQVKAKAFTLGQDLVFASGQYAPETSEGKHLLAHELTHVLQQTSNKRTGLQRKTDTESENSDESELMSDEERERLSNALCIGRQAGEGPTRCEFNSRQLRRVVSAKSQARSLAARAGLALHSPDRYIRRMARRFFDIENLNIQAMLNTIDRIRDNVDSATILCGTCSDEICNGAPAAYVPDDFSAIVICPFFFTLSLGQMVRTFLHEAGHYVKIDDAPDYEHPHNCTESDSVDCDDPCSGISDRLNNVDVWARFIECAAYSY